MKKQYNVLSSTLAVSSLLLLAGCAGYKTQPLPCITSKQASKNAMNVACKVYTKEDCKKYLGVNALCKSYQPLQLTFTNNTSNTYRYTHRSLSLEKDSLDCVLEKLHKSKRARIIAWSVVGGIGLIACWPALWVAACTTGAAHAVAMATLCGTALIPLPAMVSIKASEHDNQKLDDILYVKAFQDTFELRPNTSVSGVVFASKKVFTENFTVTLWNTETDEVTTLKPSMYQV